MQIKFTKNIQFTKLIKADGRLREFNFRKLKVEDHDEFSVDVSNDRGDRIIFRMMKNDNSWKIKEEDLPEWIQDNEELFSEQIEEELKNA